MTENPNNYSSNLPSGCPLIPESILTANRCEHTELNLEIEGQLPEDLQGHFFMVAPVGTVDSGGLPFPDGDSFLNGDGMIYRLDFDRPGEARIKTRLVKPADYYADKATQLGSPYEKYRFRNHGIVRFSYSLGFRNELNTAFLPMPSADESLDRLLVTYDVSRPYELDTETLEVVTPVGSNQEWQAEINKPKYPFKPILSTAHPAFDAYTGEMFSVNDGRAIINFMETLPAILALEELPEEIYQLVSTVIGFFDAGIIRDILRFSLQLGQDVIQKNIEILLRLIGENISDFVYLIRWDGTGYLERWKLLLPSGSPVRIKQTIHQIGVTKDYVILMDTSFITGIEQVLNNPLPNNKKVEETLRELLESPNLPNSSIYIVSRSDLKAGQNPAYSDKEVTVIAKKLVIPLPAAHFLVDYENPDGEITLHVAHIASWDVAEWIRKYDLSAYPPYHPIAKRVYSMEPNEMDISRLGRYVIDGNRGEVIQSNVIYSSPYTWGTGLYAYRDRLSSGRQPKRLDNIYWISFGLWQETMTKFLYDLYKDTPYRAVALEDLLNLAKQGVPSSLFRLHTPDDFLKIADSYQFPRGYIGSSPQFVPRYGSEENSTEGYIICSVFTPSSSEFWIFDGGDLAQGPLTKLRHQDLNFGYSLHTAWLPKIGRRQVSYNIPVKSDFQQLVNDSSPDIQKLFEDEIYPFFPSDN
ncbi:carotenoid oxygenase family protein [Microcystis aeruginosa FACHB-524]|uniref:carotenoid oxygenase family protein n=1 Tax=Microcystis aeruginosa TaxID=1126 RepID=UPI000F44D021|nr:carotenoid oxygenase family protein [Microcystis aeruginosa]ROH96663.1 lignostilbene-alpha,beta-dioxygenase [Microcystis aeruginosa FACHB-524]